MAVPQDDAIMELRKQLTRIAATKKIVMSNASRLGTSTDTGRLRDQVNSMLTQLKQQLEDGLQTARHASHAVMSADSSSQQARSRDITNVQQMERQLKAIADEYPALVRDIAAKQRQFKSRPTSQKQEHTELQPLLPDPASSSGHGTAGQAQLMQQVQQQGVNALEVQQLSQDVQERDRAIGQLVDSAVEIRQVAADIACLIEHQTASVEQVAVHVEDVAHNVDRGAQEVQRANSRQRKYRVPLCGWVLMVMGIAAALFVGLNLW